MGSKPPGSGTFQQSRFQTPTCLGLKAWLATRSPRAFQTLAPMPAPGPVPAVSSRATDFEAADHFRLRVALGKETRSFQAAGLQGREIPPRPKCRIHALTLAH